MDNVAYGRFGVQPAIDASAVAAAKYTQVAKLAAPMPLTLVQTQVTFGSIPRRGDGSAPELVLNGGYIEIPAAVTGRWSVAVRAMATLAGFFDVEGRLTDTSGVAVDTQDNITYPCSVGEILQISKMRSLGNLPFIYKTDATKAYRLQIWATALAVLNLTYLNIEIGKL